jgi:acyl carrier protein
VETGAVCAFSMTENTFKADDDVRLREALKRCSPGTYLAAREFRKTGSVDHLPAIVHGVIERYVDRDLRGKLRTPHDGLRLAEDLGLDSLSMMEIVMLAEEILRITIDNDELRCLRTLGDITQFIEGKLRDLPRSGLIGFPGDADERIGA